jgi:membrane-bound lytic murein transglycosylase MltF
VAAGTVNQTTFLPKTSLVARVTANAPTHTVAFDVLHRTPASRVAPGGLDAGLEHERISFWIDRFSTTLAGGFERSLGRMSKYTEMITAKLEAKQAPRDLIYLAMIESEFNPSARSPMKAVGMWQFMTATARRFGLAVGPKVDERKDPARATDAAVEYLSSLHDRFGSWYLAAAAYNSGEGTVLRALKKVTGRSTGTDEDFFRILPTLPRETQDYVPKLIAAARIGNAPHEYGLTVREPVGDGEIVAAPAKKATVRQVVLKTRAKVLTSPKRTRLRSSTHAAHD